MLTPVEPHNSLVPNDMRLRSRLLTLVRSLLKWPSAPRLDSIRVFSGGRVSDSRWRAFLLWLDFRRPIERPAVRTLDREWLLSLTAGVYAAADNDCRRSDFALKPEGVFSSMVCSLT